MAACLRIVSDSRLTVKKTRLLAFVRPVGVVSLALLALSLSAQASTVVKVKVDDTIQPISAEYIARAIEQARQTHADAVLIELHTPGSHRFHPRDRTENPELPRTCHRV